MPSPKERLVNLLTEIVDHHLDPKKETASVVIEARRAIAGYWKSREATRRDAWSREKERRTDRVNENNHSHCADHRARN